MDCQDGIDVFDQIASVDRSEKPAASRNAAAAGEVPVVPKGKAKASAKKADPAMPPSLGGSSLPKGKKKGLIQSGQNNSKRLPDRVAKAQGWLNEFADSDKKRLLDEKADKGFYRTVADGRQQISSRKRRLWPRRKRNRPSTRTRCLLL